MGFALPHIQFPWDKPPPAPEPEVVAAFSDLVTGCWILATIVLAAALQQFYSSWRRGGQRRAMISCCLQRLYGLPALASLRNEAITACAEMWLAFERRRASGGGGGAPPSPEVLRTPGTPRRSRSAPSLETVFEDALAAVDPRSAEEAAAILQILSTKPPTTPAGPRTPERPLPVVVAPDPFTPSMGATAPPGPRSGDERPPARRKPSGLLLPHIVDAAYEVVEFTDDGGSAPGDGDEPSPPRAPLRAPIYPTTPAFSLDGIAATTINERPAPVSTPPAVRSSRKEEAPPPLAAFAASKGANHSLSSPAVVCSPGFSSPASPSSVGKRAASGKAPRRQIVVLGDAGAAKSAVVDRIGRLAKKHGVDLVVHEGIPRGCDAIDAFHSQVDAALVVWDAALAEGRDQVQKHFSSLRLQKNISRSFSLERLSEALLPGMPPPEEAAEALSSEDASSSDDEPEGGSFLGRGSSPAKLRALTRRRRRGDSADAPCPRGLESSPGGKAAPGRSRGVLAPDSPRDERRVSFAPEAPPAKLWRWPF